MCVDEYPAVRIDSPRRENPVPWRRTAAAEAAAVMQAAATQAAAKAVGTAESSLNVATLPRLMMLVRR